MSDEQQTLLQERVRNLVLRYSIEAVIARLSDLKGACAEDELQSLRRNILSAAQRLPDKAPKEKLAVLSAVEDASDTIRTAFGKIHDRHAVRPPAGLALVT